MRFILSIAVFVVLSAIRSECFGAKPEADEPITSVLRQKGFETFVQGHFGNAGQNLYVSRAGVLQRIFQFDFNRDGWVDLVFCNSHSHSETPPLYVYSNLPTGCEPTELPCNGAVSGAVADLNGDGFDDIVVGMGDNGVRQDLNACIFFGSSEGPSENRRLELPAPKCRSVATGDFNGDGKPDLAFLLDKELRIFYQSAWGFEPKRFITLPVHGVEITADSLQEGPCADLIVRTRAGDLVVYWGGRDGLKLSDASTIQAELGPTEREQANRSVEAAGSTDLLDNVPLPRVVRLKGAPHLFLPLPDSVRFVPVGPDQKFGPPIVLHCSQAMAAAVGDMNGDGQQDLVVACRQPAEGDRQQSWVYWGRADGYNESRRAPLDSYRACDVAVADFDADGCDDIVLCQSHTAESFTTMSLVYRGNSKGIVSQPIEIVSESARRVLLSRPPAQKPQVILVNQKSRRKGGNQDVSIYPGSPQGFAAERRWKIAGWDAVESLPCDLNDDGWVDLVVANTSENAIERDQGSYVFYNGPAGLPYQPNLKLPTTRAHGVCCADMNRDGYLDLVFSAFDNNDLLFFSGTAHGFDTAHPHRIRLAFDGTVCTQVTWVYLADLNNDGWLDLVAPMIRDDRSLVLWGGPDGFDIERRLVLLAERAACARAADLTGSGNLDLILGGHIPTIGIPHDSFAYVFWNGSEGLRQDRHAMLPALGINSMAVADFNNDGALDLFVSSYHAGTTRDCDSYVYWNRKGRGFAAADRARLFTHSASGCVAGDFNEDGWVDLAIAYHRVWGDHVGYSEIWWNGPKGFSEQNVTRLPTEGPHGMTAIELGNQRDRGPEEYYESSPLNLPEDSTATKISWVAETPPKTWVKAQVRWAATKAELKHAAWTGPDGAGTWFTNGQRMDGMPHAGKWMAYRLALGATNAVATPRVTEVSIEHTK